MDKEFFQLYTAVAAALVGGLVLMYAVVQASGPGPFVLILVIVGIAAAVGGSGKKCSGGGGGAEDYPFGPGD